MILKPLGFTSWGQEGLAVTLRIPLGLTSSDIIKMYIRDKITLGLHLTGKTRQDCLRHLRTRILETSDGNSRFIAGDAPHRKAGA